MNKVAKSKEAFLKLTSRTNGSALAEKNIELPSKGKALVLKVDNGICQLYKEYQNQKFCFDANISADLMLKPTVNDLVLYEYIEDQYYILNILKFAAERDICEIVLPLNAEIKSNNNIDLMAPNISCNAELIQQRALRLTQDVKRYELRAESSSTDLKVLNENIQTYIQQMNIFKSTVSLISDVHHANSSITIDQTYSINAEYVKIDADGHVDLDGKKINLG